MNTLQNSTDGRQLRLADVMPFSWDRICIFTLQDSREYINNALGFQWLKGEIQAFNAEINQIFVFLEDGAVTHVPNFPGGGGLLYNVHAARQSRSSSCWGEERFVIVTSYLHPNGERIASIELPKTP